VSSRARRAQRRSELVCVGGVLKHGSRRHESWRASARRRASIALYAFASSTAILKHRAAVGRHGKLPVGRGTCRDTPAGTGIEMGVCVARGFESPCAGTRTRGGEQPTSTVHRISSRERTRSRPQSALKVPAARGKHGRLVGRRRRMVVNPRLLGTFERHGRVRGAADHLEQARCRGASLNEEWGCGKATIACRQCGP
jgi:hypothetical protein